MLIAIGGLSGTGKSSLARELAPHVAPAPGALLLRSDVERKSFLGLRKPSTFRPKPIRSRRVPKSMESWPTRLPASWTRVIRLSSMRCLPSRTSGPRSRRLRHQRGTAFRGLFLVADLQTRLNRVGTRGLDASDANADIARQQESFELGRIEWIKIDASGSLPETLELARAAIR